MTPDLSLVPTDVLMDALKARFDHMIFAGLMASNGNVDRDTTAWSGHSVMCVGLAMDLVRHIHEWERGPIGGEHDG